MPGKRILVVDDDAKTVELVKLYLNRDGYKVITSYDGLEALRIARESRPDLIVLDLMLPGLDGLQVCRTLRAESDVPIIMLTAKTAEQDRLVGLDLGADDYIIKPFRMRELVARIRAVLRRADGASEKTELLHVGEIILDQAAHTITVGGELVSLTPIEFDLLAVFMHSPGQVFTRTQLVDHLLNSGFTGLDRTLNVHIRNIRTKIESDPDHPRHIETVFGVGYRLHRPD
jgi:DNA-binding response OmpR family regulator